MENPWGIPLTIIGLLMFLGGITKSDFIAYRLIADRPRMLWGNHVHSFFVVAGLMVAVFGVLVALGVIHR